MSELADFCARLARLRSESGDPTLVWLSGQPLCPSKSQLSKIFRGQASRLPDADVVRGIVHACARWAERYGHKPLLPTDERHWLVERDIVERRLDEAPSPRAAGCTLPRDLATFTGREQDLAALLDAARDRRVVEIQAVDGMPGVGKTALAVHAAHKLADRFPDGQFFVDLRGYTRGRDPVEPSEALETLLLAVGVDARAIPAHTDARAALWRERMAGKKALLLLDNARTDEQLHPLLPGSAQCLVLITSRHRLAALQDVHTLTLDVLPPEQAKALFLRLAKRADDEPDAAAELVRLCGYLPLAVGLLAGRLRHRPTWTLQHLTDRVTAALADSADRLGEFRADNAAVATTFELSYQDLTEANRRLFRRLALHPSTEFDVYAAAALDDASIRQTTTRLESLYDDHLIIEVSPGRYRFHDLVRHYAADVAVDNEAEAPIGRLLDFYVHATRQAISRLPPFSEGEPQPPLAGPCPAALPGLDSRSAATAWLATEQPTLSRCCEYGIAHGYRQAVYLATALDLYLRLHGHLQHARALYGVLLGADDLSNNHRAHLLRCLGVVEYLLGDYEVAGHTLARSIELFDGGPDLQGLANAHTDRAVHQQLRNVSETARQHLATAQRLYEETGSKLGMARTFDTFGMVERRVGAYDAAHDALVRSRALYLEIANELGLATSLANLGAVELLRGANEASGEYLTEALAIYERLDSALGRANVLSSLAIVRRRTGAHAESMRCLRLAHALYRDAGSRLGEANALNGIGMVHQLCGELPAAVDALERAHALYEAIKDDSAMATNLNDLGRVYLLVDDREGARKVLNQALELATTSAFLLGEAEVLNTLGALESNGSRWIEARQHYVRALEITRRIGAKTEQARSLDGLGHCARHDGDPARARELLEDAENLFRVTDVAEADRVAAVLREMDDAEVSSI